MLISLERLIFASIEISEQYSKQLNAISIISLFKSKCWDFSFVKTNMNDLIKVSLSSALGSFVGVTVLLDLSLKMLLR
jgi:hypothetical protein